MGSGGAQHSGTAGEQPQARSVTAPKIARKIGLRARVRGPASLFIGGSRPPAYHANVACRRSAVAHIIKAAKQLGESGRNPHPMETLAPGCGSGSLPG
jgi:hypothetical protein